LAAQTLVDSTLFAPGVPQLQRLAETEVRVTRVLCAEMAARLQEYFGARAVVHFGTLRQRVIRHLLDAAGVGQSDARLLAPLTQQNLADAVGSVREVVARILQVLRSEGLVGSGPEGIVLLEPVRLHAETERPGL
jgi:CRP/FNR family transcriptional regulator